MRKARLFALVVVCVCGYATPSTMLKATEETSGNVCSKSTAMVLWKCSAKCERESSSWKDFRACLEQCQSDAEESFEGCAENDPEFGKSFTSAIESGEGKLITRVEATKGATGENGCYFCDDEEGGDEGNGDRSPEQRPESRPPSVPQPPRESNGLICCTYAGACPLPYPGPLGTPCYCTNGWYTAYGQVCQ